MTRAARNLAMSSKMSIDTRKLTPATAMAAWAIGTFPRRARASRYSTALAKTAATSWLAFRPVSAPL
jgi:hypothetical protein